MRSNIDWHGWPVLRECACFFSVVPAHVGSFSRACSVSRSMRCLISCSRSGGDCLISRANLPVRTVARWRFLPASQRGSSANGFFGSTVLLQGRRGAGLQLHDWPALPRSSRIATGSTVALPTVPVLHSVEWPVGTLTPVKPSLAFTCRLPALRVMSVPGSRASKPEKASGRQRPCESACQKEDVDMRRIYVTQATDRLFTDLSPSYHSSVVPLVPLLDQTPWPSARASTAP